MDRMTEHAMKMLKIVENRNPLYHDEQGDIVAVAQAIYDLILKVEILDCRQKKEEGEW